MSSPYRPREKFPIKAWSYEGFEIECTGELLNQLGAKLCVEGPIKSGTSGGPIVNIAGELISIASTVSVSTDDHPSYGADPIIRRTLPEFIRDQVVMDESAGLLRKTFVNLDLKPCED